MKLLEFMSKAIKLLLTELVSQCKGYIVLSLFDIDLPSVNQCIPELTSIIVYSRSNICSI